MLLIALANTTANHNERMTLLANLPTKLKAWDDSQRWCRNNPVKDEALYILWGMLGIEEDNRARRWDSLLELFQYRENARPVFALMEIFSP